MGSAWSVIKRSCCRRTENRIEVGGEIEMSDPQPAENINHEEPGLNDIANGSHLATIPHYPSDVTNNNSRPDSRSVPSYRNHVMEDNFPITQEILSTMPGASTEVSPFMPQENEARAWTPIETVNSVFTNSDEDDTPAPVAL